MEFSFREALDKLGPNAGFRIVNEAVRPDSAYLFNTLLPEMPKPSYYVDNGYMVIRPIMAGLVGMSSPYPPGSVMDASTFLEKTGKVANKVTLEEEAIRQIQELLRNQGLQGEQRKAFLADEVFNFQNLVIRQGQTDTAEWLRSEALFKGKIDWTFNGINLLVDYGVPSTFFGTHRSGNDKYTAEHADNKFWTDHYAALAALYYNVRAIIAHTDTVLKLINTMQLNVDVSQNGNVFTFKRWRTRGNNERPASDSRDALSIIAYDLEGEVIDAADVSKTKKVQFAPSGKILYVANNNRAGYRVGEGAVPDPARSLALGHTHLAPTVEGDGKMGRWGRVFIPEDAQWSIRGEGASNLLPVREDVTADRAKTYVLSTDL